MKVPIVTAIGEILYDLYPDGKKLGGAPFNFLYHVQKILGKGYFISSVGTDENGREILELLSARGFDTSFIQIDEIHPTGVVKVTIQEGGNPKFEISAESSYDYINLSSLALKLIEETDLLYFGTLAQRSSVTRSTIRSLFGKEMKYFCDLNLRHNFFDAGMVREALEVSNIVKINTDELAKIKALLKIEGDERNAAVEILRKYKIDLLAVTMGADGAALFTETEYNYYKPKIENIIDTLGAGDAYSALLCIGYLYGWPIAVTNKLANEFAAEICGISGAIPPDDSIYKKYAGIVNV